MTTREEYLDTIEDKLAWLSRYIQQKYDINLATETIVAGLLNLVYGYRLKNANVLKANMHAIDLFDSENRIAIQVTSDTSLRKIRNTLSLFKKEQYRKSFNRLIFFYIIKKAPKRKKINCSLPDAGIDFNIESDVWDYANVLRSLSDSETPLDKLYDITTYLDEQLGYLRLSQPSFIKTQLSGKRYVAEYIQELLTTVFESWKYLEINYHSGDKLDSETIAQTTYFKTYYEGRLRRNLNVDAFERLVFLFNNVLTDSFENDIDYAVEISKKLNEYFSDSLCISTEQFILDKTDGYALNHNKVLNWKHLLYAIFYYWRNSKERFLIKELQNICNYHLCLNRILRIKNYHPDPTTVYATLLYPKEKWAYKICIIDDDEEYRNTLKSLIEERIKNNCLYNCVVKVFANGNSARTKTDEINFDVFVLDVVNENDQLQLDDSTDKANLYLGAEEVTKGVYFGADFINLILKVKPDAEVSTKFFVYSKLQKSLSMKQFNKDLSNNDIDISYLSKEIEKKNTAHSNQRLVNDIISYLDDLYLNEIMPL